MIISRITGGLGNQLFQFAAGTALAERLGTVLKLDLSFYEEESQRNFELPKFNTKIITASKEECSPFIDQGIVERAFYRLLPAYRRPVYKQPGFGYDPFFEEAENGKYLKGYWQSWKFFDSVQALIRQQYVINSDYIKHLQPLAEEWRNTETVSVHIRHGDYKSPAALAYHGLLSSEYYNQALDRIHTLYPGVKIMFFSDDMEWVLQNIHTNLPHRFITGQITQNALEDFYLMQHCRHHIIANSSFSWWAAWLNPSLSKTVIAPRNWFADAGNETRDILPPDWIQI